MSSREPEGNAHFDLRVKIEQHRPRNAQYGPSSYFYWFLAHQFAADNVLFADVAPDADRSTYNERWGRVFIVTTTAIVIADYANAAEEEDGDPQQNFGTVDLELHSRDTSTMSLRWSDRNLRIPKNQYGSMPRCVRLSVGTLSLHSSGWSALLPGEEIADADDYVARLREAIGL